MRNFLAVSILIGSVSLLTGCATAVAVTDAAVSTTIYAGKTVINVIDAVTPDIVNKD